MSFNVRANERQALARLIAGNVKYTPDEWFRELQSAARAAASTEFKKEIEKRIDYYYGRFQTYLEDILKKQFKTYKALKLQMQYVNAIKTITDELSVIYLFGVKRHLYHGEEAIEDPDDPERKLFDWILKTSKYDRVLDTTNRMVTLCNGALLRAFFWGTTGEIRLQTITPNQVDVIQHPDDPSEMVALYYSSQPTDEYLKSQTNKYYNRIVYHYWDAHNYRRYIEGAGMVAVEGNPDGINPYGVIPFVKFTNGLSSEGFWLDTGYDLTNAQDNINTKLTFLNHVIKLQSFSVPVLKGYEKKPGDKEEVVVSPGQPILLPLARRDEGQPDFAFVSPSPSIDAIKKEIADEYQRLFGAYGLNRQGFDAIRTAQSGYALKIENTMLMERRQREVPYYEDAEEELFQVIKKIWNTHADSLPAEHPFRGVKFAEDTKLHVSINDPQFPDAPAEKQAKWEFLFAQKLATPIDYFVQEEHLSEQEAEETYDRIKQWHDKNAPKPTFEDKFKAQPPENPFDETAKPKEKENGNENE